MNQTSTIPSLDDDVNIEAMLAAKPRNPWIEMIVDVLCTRTQNTERQYFRTKTAYFLAKMASSMKTSVRHCLQNEDQAMPTNVYAICLADSGFGKGYSVKILQHELMKPFQDRYMKDTFPMLADDRLLTLAIERSAWSGKTEKEEKEKIDKQFRGLGPAPFTFTSPTLAAVKGVRDKLLLAGIGSINFQLDEIGQTLRDSAEALPVFLELYDAGLTEIKLTKNTSENERYEQIDGPTPASCMLFGTYDTLLDGGLTQAFFMSQLKAGWARRSLFGWGESDGSRVIMSAKERMKQQANLASSHTEIKLQTHFGNLADPLRHNWETLMDEDVTEAYFSYQNWCETRASALPEHAGIEKNEMRNRHSKAMKLSGTLAFVDEMNDVSLDHLLQAIQIVEDSAEAMDKALHPEEPYIKLARHLSTIEGPQTGAKLMELPYYKNTIGGEKGRSELMRYAASWGYTNNVIIKKTYDDGIEMFEGESLAETSLDQIAVSYSNHEAFNYEGVLAPWNDLEELVTIPDAHFCVHAFENDHRNTDNVIPGFNMIVADIDEQTRLETVHEIMEDYTFMTYTTKRHTDEQHRFRLLIPMSHILRLDTLDYSDFMENIMKWLPFRFDRAMMQIAKKWQTNEHAQVYTNEGQLLNILPFIPKTSRNEQFHRDLEPLQDLDNLERWFAQKFSEGDRNNQMIRYSLALCDKTDLSPYEIKSRINRFNSSLSNGLSQEEIDGTIMVTVGKRLAQNAA